MFKKKIDEKTERKFQAEIGRGNTWWGYYSHYKTAVDYIVEGIEQNMQINRISYPLAFLIRHSLELALKANILKFETISPARNKLRLDTHNLEVLFDFFSDHLNYLLDNNQIQPYLVNTIKSDLLKTGKLKNVLHELDKGSYNFRYPVDRENRNNFAEDQVIQVADIVKAFYEVQAFLVFVDSSLYEQGVFGFDE